MTNLRPALSFHGFIAHAQMGTLLWHTMGGASRFFREKSLRRAAR